MTRTELTDCVIPKRHYRRDLEIGGGDGRDHFDQVMREHRPTSGTSVCAANINPARTGTARSELTACETPAMEMIQDWALNSAENGTILYFHTKGVGAPHDPIKRKWRNLMNHEVLMNSRQVVQKLDLYDVIGVNWRNCQPVVHFYGNFWWTRSDCVRSFTPFDTYYESPRYPTNWDGSRRLGCEFWISSAPRAPRVPSLACNDKDFCNPSFWSRFSHPAVGDIGGRTARVSARS